MYSPYRFKFKHMTAKLKGVIINIQAYFFQKFIQEFLVTGYLIQLLTC